MACSLKQHRDLTNLVSLPCALFLLVREEYWEFMVSDEAQGTFEPTRDGDKMIWSFSDERTAFLFKLRFG